MPAFAARLVAAILPRRPLLVLVLVLVLLIHQRVHVAI